MTPPAEENILSVAYINIRGQTGLSSAKQDQIETFILINKQMSNHLQYRTSNQYYIDELIGQPKTRINPKKANGSRLYNLLY